MLFQLLLFVPQNSKQGFHDQQHTTYNLRYHFLVSQFRPLPQYDYLVFRAGTVVKIS